MIISKYNHNIYKDKDLNEIGLVNLLNKKVYDMVSVDSSEIYKNIGSKNIVELVDKIYANGLILDLSEDEIEEVKQLKVEVRFQGSIEEIKQNHRLNKFLTKMMSADGYKQTKYENLADSKINEIISKIKPGYGLNIFKAKKLSSIFDEKGVRQKNRLNSVVVGVESEQVMGGLEKLMNEVGFGMKEMSEYVFLHEFSHAIQHLKVNHEPLLSVGNQEEELMGTKTRWMNDLKYLGHTSYSKNVSYSVLAETYADVRAVLMYAQLFPSKADNMLDVLIKWRGDIGKDDLHDTYQGLLLLKEVLLSNIDKKMDAAWIHQISREISTLVGLASVETVLRKYTEYDSKLSDMDALQVNMKINFFKGVGIFAKDYTDNQFMDDLYRYKLEVLDNIGLSSGWMIDNHGSEKNQYNGKNYVRDRNGLIIRNSMIEEGKLKNTIIKSSGFSLSDYTNKLESHYIESNVWNIILGVFDGKELFKKMIFSLMAGVPTDSLPKVLEGVEVLMQENYKMYIVNPNNRLIKKLFDAIYTKSKGIISKEIDGIYDLLNSNLQIIPKIELDLDSVKEKLKIFNSKSKEIARLSV